VPVELRNHVRTRSAELGFYAADFPEEVGGQGLSQVGMVLLREAAEATGARLATFVTWGSEGPSPVLLRGTFDQQQRYLAPLVRGQLSRCLAMTEADAGSDVLSIRTTAVQDGGAWVLNGTKQFVSDADRADIALVLAVTDPENRDVGITAFIVETDTPGFSLGSARTGLVEEPLFEVRLENCVVASDAVVGGPDGVGMGFQLAMEYFAIGRLSIAARCNGIAEYILDLGLNYAANRRAFGRAIGANQYVQGPLVDSAVELRASKLLTYEAATLLDTGDLAIEASARAKLYASEMAHRVVDRVLQIHGGAGWLHDLPIERAYRFVRMFRIIDGTSEMQRHIIASALGLPTG
jgi:alkylation response protein AidB-like acyl-CoA dehydrogenase